MDKKDFDEHVADVAEQVAITFSKTAFLDENNFIKLKYDIVKEVTLAFSHLLVE